MKEQKEKRMLSPRQQLLRAETAGDLELGLLAACWGDQDNAKVLLGVATMEDFHTPSGRQQFQALRDCWRQFKSADVFSIRKASADRGFAESWTNVQSYWESGDWTGYGPGQLTTLHEQVRQGSCRHNMLEALAAGQRVLNDPDKPTAEACAEISASFTKASFLSRRAAAESYADGLESLAQRVDTKLAQEAAGVKTSPRLSTGWNAFDELTGGGLGAAEYTVWAARPRVGKTAAMLQMATHIAEKYGPVLVLSLELSKAVCWARIACQQLQLPLKETWKKPDLIRQAAARNVRLFIDDAPLKPDQLLQRFELFRVEHPDAVYLFLDQISHLATDPSDYKAMTYASTCCRRLTRETGIGMSALAQVGRRGEDREGGRPKLADLKATGSIEEDARMVAFLHRPPLYAAKGKCDPFEAQIIVAKNGEGSEGDCEMRYNGPTYTLSDPPPEDLQPRKKKAAKNEPPDEPNVSPSLLEMDFY